MKTSNRRIRYVNLTGVMVTVQKGKREIRLMPVEGRKPPKVTEAFKLERESGPYGLPVNVPAYKILGLPKPSAPTAKTQRIYIVTAETGEKITDRSDIFYPKRFRWGSTHGILVEDWENCA
jgi:hypothetical protein